MRLFALPARIDALIFDVDSTLYTDAAFAEAQVSGQVRRLSERLGLSLETTEKLLDERRERYAAERGGAKISLGNLFVGFGVSIEESVRWREELIDPTGFLQKDDRLDAALAELGKRCALGVVTNNPEKVARRILSALGVEDRFPVIVGLDACGVSKPHPAPFRKAAAALSAAPGACVSVGDRWDIDIALPLELGMGGVLVSGVEDVYALPAALSAAIDGGAVPCESGRK